MESVRGLQDNPLQLTWASGEPKAAPEPSLILDEESLERGSDYESITLMRLIKAQRQAEEEKRRAEEEKRQVEEEKRLSEEEKILAEETVHNESTEYFQGHSS